MAGQHTPLSAECKGLFWAGLLVVLEPPCLCATERVEPSDRMWLGTECLLP